ncbi:hypothetical protein F4775DRAFT_588413 [Biscogniauxia sp. FL1348]|nr:hypothetical protein F4775DRAFT_588413 [Biscogniauxia sp. FL1348]
MPAQPVGCGPDPEVLLTAGLGTDSAVPPADTAVVATALPVPVAVAVAAAAAVVAAVPAADTAVIAAAEAAAQAAVGAIAAAPAAVAAAAADLQLRQMGETLWYRSGSADGSTVFASNVYEKDHVARATLRNRRDVNKLKPVAAPAVQRAGIHV